MQYSGTLFCVQSKFLGYCENTLRVTCWERLRVMGQRGILQLPSGVWRHTYPVSLGLDFVAVGVNNSCICAGITDSVESLQALQIIRRNLWVEIRDICKLSHPPFFFSTDWGEKWVPQRTPNALDIPALRIRSSGASHALSDNIVVLCSTECWLWKQFGRWGCLTLKCSYWACAKALG